MYKLVNGVEAPLTSEELNDLEAREVEHKKKLEDMARVAYKSDRRREYPSFEEVMEALIEDREGRPEKLADISTRRAVIKEKFPKPEVNS